VDLPSWRAGRTGGGQNFDFERQSVLNRDVVNFKVQTNYWVNRNNTLRFDYRFRNIDREYLEIEQGSTDTQTMQNRFTVGWNSRFSKWRGMVNFEYEKTDIPFANKYAMCERPLENEEPLKNNKTVYYFQRERLADASNQPSDSLRLNAIFTVLANAKFSMNLQGMLKDDRNDNLNSYEWQQDVATAGLNFFLVPSEKSLFTIGYNYLNYKSNAVFCLPVMDG
jgi:hypothetical protein